MSSARPDRRIRQQYENDGGPVGFSNPDKDGIISMVSYCIVDRMINIFINRTPFEGDEAYWTMAGRIRESTQQVTGYYPSGSITVKPMGMRYNAYMPLYTGEVDLQDVVEIFEGVPELETGWMREKLAALRFKPSRYGGKVRVVYPPEPPGAYDYEL